MMNIAAALLAMLQPAPFLSSVFGDHMVLQRGKPNTFWGWSTPGTAVTVSIGRIRASAVTDSEGKWTARLSPPPVGGPYTVEIDGPQHVELKDVMVGDVWICSGQSNMEMGITLVRDADKEVAAANDPGLRLYIVPRATSLQAEKLTTGSWAACTSQSVAEGGWGGFSAAGYFFGRELRRRLGVPIGLVETSWGGTVAEAWTSEEGLRPMKDFDAALKIVNEARSVRQTPYSELLDKWFLTNDPGSKEGWQNSSFDDSGWKAAEFPITYEALGLGAFDGVGWFRRDFDLPDPLPAGAATLALGTIDDMDTTWVNGVKVGETMAFNLLRNYTLPAGVLHPGHNQVTVRVLDTGSIGGFTAPAGGHILKLGDGTAISMGGNWKYAFGADMKSAAALPATLEGNPNVPTVLYNGMISPLLPLAIKGAIWYQGESNADRAAQYRRLLPTMIGDWRRSWGQGDFPFYIVQLANFATRHPQPSEDAWAELREAQWLTSQNVKNSGLAVAIDIGDAQDIHPTDKQDIGLRLALAALHSTYRQNVEFSGPVFKKATRHGGTMRIEFDHGDGLKFTGPALAGFQVAGADHKFHWASASIDRQTVVVSSSEVLDPVAVRYAWDSNPEATLYNGAGLPAVPFRTDGPAVK